MLTEKDLAIVRAALQYLDEEMSPSADDTLNYYLDDRGILLGATAADIKPARQAFEKVALYYAKKKLELDELDSVELVPASSNDELNYLADHTELVSVLATRK
jgi:hypothetical protein